MNPAALNHKKIRLGLGLILTLGAAAAGYYHHASAYARTDNAYVAGVIVPVAAEVRGKVTAVFIQDNQLVESGAPLIEVHSADYQNTLEQKSMAAERIRAEQTQTLANLEQTRRNCEQARANLAAARAEESLSARDLKRYAGLITKDVISQSQYDTIAARWQVTLARQQAAEPAVAEAGAASLAIQARLQTQAFGIREAEAACKQARRDLERTIIRAPISGRIAMKNVNPGKYVQPGQGLLSIVQRDTWVVANFKETQIRRMASGQPVTIKADAYPGVQFKGHVDSFQPGTGAVFSLIPPENATGNFVKVVQRVPVKIVIDSSFDEAHPLWPGLSVEPTVALKAGDSPRLASK